jgi:hypothetical protein
MLIIFFSAKLWKMNGEKFDRFWQKNRVLANFIVYGWVKKVDRLRGSMERIFIKLIGLQLCGAPSYATKYT